MYKVGVFNMIKFLNLKSFWAIIFILFISFLLPFNVEAKELYNVSFLEESLDDAELISGDDIVIGNVFEYVPVDNQMGKIFNVNRVTKF